MTTVATGSPPRLQQEEHMHTVRKSRTETALDWFQRCQQRRATERQEADVPPETPAGAAWSFFKASTYGGTGVSFVDESFRRCNHQGKLPALEIRSSQHQTGKTRTLVALAARYAVATRPSLFAGTRAARGSTSQRLPRVIFCDSALDVTPLQLAHAVSSQLLLRQGDSSCVAALEQDVQECLDRINLVSGVEDIRDWVPVLECLRGSLAVPSFDYTSREEEEQDDFPTLLLWDGFLSEPTNSSGGSSNNQGMQREISRQLARLLQDCTVGLVYTRSATSSLDSSYLSMPRRPDNGTIASLAHQTVVLARDESPDRRHDFKATVVHGNQQIPYSLSAAGVLR